MAKKRRRKASKAMVRRARPVAFKKARRKSTRRTSGWLPLTTKEIILDGAIGAVVGPISTTLRPYQQQYLGMFGEYSDEAALAIVGSVGHKFGSGLVKDASKELFRVAVISAGTQLGNNLFAGSASNGNGVYL